MTRRKQTDPETQIKLLDAAMILMLQKGYTATSVDEICQAAGVTKGSFFYYFASKELLGQAVLRHFQVKIGALLDQGPHRLVEDPLQRLYAYCDYLAAMFAHPEVPKSCLLGNLAQELAPTQPAIGAVCAAGFAWWATEIEQGLETARQHYTPRWEFDSHEVAEHLIAIFEGALILAKAQQDIGVVGRNLAHFKHYLELLFGVAQHDALTDFGGVASAS
ncbi:MAG: TetR/AcrR family transcriptional regulator [Caldilineaceae bacterium]